MTAGGGNKQFLRSFVEATAFRYTQEGFQLRVIHGKYHSFLFCFFLNQQAFAPPWESSRTGQISARLRSALLHRASESSVLIYSTAQTLLLLT